VPAAADGTSGAGGSTGTTPTVPRPVLRVVASRTRVHAVRGRRTTLVVRVLRGRVAVSRATVTLRWVARPLSWRVRTDREGRARVVLSGTRAGRLVARVAGAAVEIRVVLRTEPRRS
jgi:hypothetical protein